VGYGQLHYVGDLGRQVTFEVLRNNGNPGTEADWLDLAAPYPLGATDYPDYYDGLMSLPKVTHGQTKRRVYHSNVSTIAMDNSPWAGNAYGFWSAPLPLTLHRNGVDYTFSAWGGRRVRIRVKVYGADGIYVSTVPIGHFRIKEVKRRGYTAQVQLEDLWQQLFRRDASTVKQGSVWYRSASTGYLMTRLLTAADPTIEIDPLISSGSFEFGTHSAQRASSWGATPGILVDGEPFVHKWVIRCMTHDPDDANKLWVGWECPGNNANSDGAIGFFDLVTNKWTVIVQPSSLSGWFPISMWVPAGQTAPGYIYAMAYQEWQPTSTAWQFHRIQNVRVTRTGTLVSFLGSAMPFWPCRESLRKGVFDFAGGMYSWKCGFEPHWLNQSEYFWFGETPGIPFQQALNLLGYWMFGGTSYQLPYCYQRHIGHRGLDEASTENAPSTFMPTSVNQTGLSFKWQLAGAGCYSVEYVASSATSTHALCLRYFMQTHLAPPIALKSGTDWFFYYMSLNTTTTLLRFQILANKLTTGALEFWPLTNMGNESTQLWTRQVTAFALLPSAAAGARHFLVAEIEWDETKNGVAPPFSKVRLYKATCGSTGTPATLLSRWSQQSAGASGDIYSPTIVALWTPYDAAVDVGTKAGAYSVAVICHRGETGGTTYGLGVWVESPTARWIQLYKRAVGTAPEPEDAYTGPSSGMPFSGFVGVESVSQMFNFIDQGTGICWQGTVSIGNDEVTWLMTNGALPVHSTENHTSAPLGAVLCPDDGYGRTFFGMAPSTPAVIRRPYFVQQGYNVSASRREAGLFPLVMLSAKMADAIEVADFSGMKVGEAMEMLKERLWLYDMFIGMDGVFRMPLRAAGVVAAILKTKRETREPDVALDEYLFEEEPESYEDQSSIINSVDITPYGYAPQEAEPPQVIKGSGSKFAGSFMVDVRSQHPVNLSIRSALGGSVVRCLPVGSSDTARANLFIYSRVLDKIHCSLTIAAIYTATSVTVSGLTVEGGHIYSGEVEIQVGDWLQVQGGNLVMITGLNAVASGAAVIISIPETERIGATDEFVAQRYAEVIITPSERNASSVTPTGVTETTAYVDGTVITIPVANPGKLRRDMVIALDGELILIKAVRDADLLVTRGAFGSSKAIHASGTAVMAYVNVGELGRLFEVGDTGVFFGIQTFTSENLTADRSVISVGDGVIVRQSGMPLKPIETAVARVMDNASINRHEKRDKSIENRFIDHILGPMLGQIIVDEEAEPRLVLAGGVVALSDAFAIGETVETTDPHLSGTNTPVDFHVEAIAFDTKRMEMTPKLRSFDVAPGAGKREDTEPIPSPGYVVPRGGRRRDRT